MTPELLWYGASVQLEKEYSIDWGYIEIKATGEAQAIDKLRRMFREGVKIIYCQLI